MKKDWVVWLSCVLLFCTGAVWGGVDVGINFFKVDSLHDLFEIFSSAATVVAVFFAISQIDSWRRETRAQADLSQATRISRASIEYKRVAIASLKDAQTALRISKVEINDNSVEAVKEVAERIEGALENQNLKKKDFQLLLSDARFDWGDEFVRKYDPLIFLVDECDLCSKTFIAWSRCRSDDGSSRIYADSLEGQRKIFENKNLLIYNEEQMKMIGELTLEADAELRAKMLLDK